MSSHREAPEISQDPTADNTDTYAFVSPDKPDTVTILCNWVPIEAAAGGPNFYEFGDDVLYYIYISNAGTAMPDITYTFQFETKVLSDKTFLYNTGAIKSLDDPSFNRPQFYTVSKTVGKGTPKVIASGLACPPCNIGPHSTPNYPALSRAAIHQLPHNETVFAGQRNDGFFADLGAVFDLADLRPFQTLHIAPMAASIGLDSLKNGINVHTIALQIPIKNLTRDGSAPTDINAAASTIGVWGAASRRKMRLRGDKTGQHTETGPWVQVSRLGNPLFNELFIPMVRKDNWNGHQPYEDSEFNDGVVHPDLAERLPDLYPHSFENLRALAAARTPRDDLVALLLTGIKPDIFPGFQNYTGPTQADMLRLNVAIPPSTSRNDLGVLAGDPAGYPNGRRVTDDIVTLIVRAFAGAYRPKFDSSFKPDGATEIVTQGVPTPGEDGGPDSSGRFLKTFPYLGDPHDGFDNPSVTSQAGPVPSASVPGVTP